jgi:ACS family tartrate transporter-like MFS transporter
MMSLPICNVLGAPISTYLLGMNWLGIAGWKWLFIFEAIPAVVLGIVTPFYLTNRPADAKCWRMTSGLG